MSAPLELSALANPALVRALLSEHPDQVSAALDGSTLLVPAVSAGAGHTALHTRIAAGGRRVLCAFTDLEALSAWDRHPAGEAAAVAATALRELAPGTALILNPAGPGAHLLSGEPLDGNRLTVAPDDRAQLVAPAGRRSSRSQAAHAHRRARRSAAGGWLSEACDELRVAIRACHDLGDRLHGGAAELELAGWLARLGSIGGALDSWRRAAETLALLGETDLALAGLLDAAEAAAAAGRSDEAETFSITALDVVAGADVSDRLLSVWRTLDER